MTMKLTDWSN